MPKADRDWNLEATLADIVRDYGDGSIKPAAIEVSQRADVHVRTAEKWISGEVELPRARVRTIVESLGEHGARWGQELLGPSVTVTAARVEAGALDGGEAARFAKEFAEAMATFAKALADGTVTAEEALEIEREVGDAVHEGERIMRACAKVREDARRKQ